MDGRVGALRAALDDHGLAETPIIAYSAKFASAFYGPFREAADSAPQTGDRKRLPDGSGQRAARRCARPSSTPRRAPTSSWSSRRCRTSTSSAASRTRPACRWPPTTSAASTPWSRRPPAQGLLDERAAVLEALTGIRRAGADIVITYHAKDVARWLSELAKVRSRRDGAAVPLDETDKQLLNLMQGSLRRSTARPFARVAELAELSEDEVMARVQRPARQADHPRGHADLRHARARLPRRCSSRRRSTREYPHRAAQFINIAPRRHAQLPAQPRVQPVVHARRRAGLAARAATARSTCMAAKTGAESIRQLPTLKLFKIRMDLEMEARHRRAGQTAGEAVEPMELDPIELSDEDVETIRATQGPMAVRSDAYAPAAERLGVPVDEVLRAPRVAARARRPAPRRGDPLPPPRRLLGQRHGRVGGAGGRRCSRRASGWPRSAASRTATSARPTPTGRTRCSRWPTAARRRSATRSSTRSPRRPASSERATLYSSTEFKKVRMLYFTDDFRRWEAEHA